jgi:DNA polymerase I-like protein with 3'-5' exonuclease and polymerase domains
MKYVQTIEQLNELVDYYSKQSGFCFDVETVGDHRGDPRRNRVTWIALATHGRSDVIPMGHPHGDLIRMEYPLKPSGQKRQDAGLPLRKSDWSLDIRKATPVWTPAPEQLSPGEVFRGLEPLMFSDLLKVGHNLKFDLQTVAKYYRGRVPTPPYHDTMVSAYLIKSTHRAAKAPYNRPYSLGSVLNRELGFHMEKGIGKQVEVHGFEEVRKYAALDGRWTWFLYKEMESQLERDGLKKLMALEMDVLEALCSMELLGTPLDLDELKSLYVELDDILVDIKSRAYQAAGKEFSLSADREIRRLLFSPKKEGGQGLRPFKLTPGGYTKKKTISGFKPEIDDYSVDKDSLSLYEGNPLVDALLEFSVAERLQNTYIARWMEDHIDGNIHADFVQNGAETGRFSCRAPNLQNVPNPEKSELGLKMRRLFVANSAEDIRKGREYKLVVADYSQIEPRIMASFSKDPRMMAVYTDPQGLDIYETLAYPLGLPRSAGKIGILAMGYGVAPTKAAAQLKVSETEAREILSGFEKEFAAVYKYKARVVRDAKLRRPPHVVTMLGRRRYLPELFAEDRSLRSRAERQAFNTVIQGSAADLIKLAMVRLYRMLQEEIPEARMLLQVHDEIVTKCPVDQAELCTEIVREAMEGINVLNVPLIADIKVVDSWGDAKG